MPRKPGIFKLHQQEILALLKKGIGYTEITEILHQKYDLLVTKQNLEQSYKRSLNTKAKKNRKKAPKKRSGSASSKSNKKTPKGVAKSYPAEALESISNSPEDVAETLALRDRIPQIKMELETLLDEERISGRFSPTESAILSDWAQALIALHPDTARTVFRSTFGSDFLTYIEAFRNALQRIRDGNLVSELDWRARPADEETWLSSMKMSREREEKERRQKALSGSVR